DGRGAAGALQHPGRRRGAAGLGRAGRQPGDDRHRHPHRPSRELGAGSEGEERVGRPLPQGAGRGDPARLRPARGRGGRVLRAGQRGAGGRPAQARARNTESLPGQGPGRRAHRTWPQGSPDGDRPGAGSRAVGRRRHRRLGGGTRMSFTVVVPCSTSNLGAGFDALGIALGGPGLIVRVTPGGSGLRIARLSGAGADSLPRDNSNRIIEAAFAAARLGGRDPESLSAELEVHSAIPLRRGLGSSAAAALAGALVADALSGGALGEPRVLAAAVALEGHPDNVVPSLRGGAQVALLDAAGAVRSCEVRIGTALKAALFIPDVELSTREARAVLPTSVPFAGAVHHLARSALFGAALSPGRIELFAEAMDDRLHQPARASLIPWL